MRGFGGRLIADSERIAELDDASTRRDFFDEVRVTPPECVLGHVIELRGLLDADFALQLQPMGLIDGGPSITNTFC